MGELCSDNQAKVVAKDFAEFVNANERECLQEQTTRVTDDPAALEAYAFSDESAVLDESEGDTEDDPLFFLPRKLRPATIEHKYPESSEEHSKDISQHKSVRCDATEVKKAIDKEECLDSQKRE